MLAGDHKLRLLNRSWQFKDSEGFLWQRVPKSPGVVGQTPILKPGTVMRRCHAAALSARRPLHVHEPLSLSLSHTAFRCLLRVHFVHRDARQRLHGRRI